MPLVRIDIAKGHPAGFGRAVGEVVYRAMLSEINVPVDDKFQIISTHEADELNIPGSYLGIEYSPGIVFIQMTLNEGRSTELGIRRQDVFISLIEVSKENWSFGNGEMQYGPQ